MRRIESQFIGLPRWWGATHKPINWLPAWNELSCLYFAIKKKINVLVRQPIAKLHAVPAGHRTHYRYVSAFITVTCDCIIILYV